MYISIIMYMDNGIGFQTLLPRLKPNGVILKNGVIINKSIFQDYTVLNKKGTVFEIRCVFFFHVENVVVPI